MRLRPTRAAFAFVFVIVLLDMLALGIIVPVLSGLIVAFEDGDAARANDAGQLPRSVVVAVTGCRSRR